MQVSPKSPELAAGDKPLREANVFVCFSLKALGLKAAAVLSVVGVHPPMLPNKFYEIRM